MEFCYITNFPLPKQSQRSRSILQDGSRSLVLFWKEKTPSYNRRNTVFLYLYITRITKNNNTPHLKSPKNQNRRAALERPMMKLLRGLN